MRYFQLAFLSAVACLLCGTLSAQADIDVQVPVGTSITNGAKVKDGKSSNGDIINYTVRIENVGSADLDLLVPVVQGSGYKSVQVNMTSVPGAQTLTPTSFVDFNIEIDPDKDSDWSFNVTITSNDPADPTFTFKMEGTQGKPEKDEDCSTSESSGTSFLILFAVLCAAIAGARLRKSHG